MVSTKTIRATIKYPGSKWTYADWIVSYMPKHRFYVEPYFGSGAVFFTKQPTVYETINDLDGNVVNFFKACRDYPDELARKIALTPFSRQEYMQIQQDRAGEEIKLTGDIVEDARRFAIRCFQGFGSKLHDRVGWRNTKHSTRPVNPREWNSLPDRIYQVAERLKNAQIEQTDAIKLIKACNAPDCLIYADPPYLRKVRSGNRIYRHEMLDEQEHVELLTALLEHKGPVILSGYDNPLYNDMLAGWYKAQKTGYANSAEQRTETLWINFKHQTSLF